jgi:hypothetical protein
VRDEKASKGHAMSGQLDFLGIKVAADTVASPLPEMLEVFELLKPKPCSHHLIRIGDNCDGSYLVPDDLAGIAACFSPGVNNFKHFEDTLVETYGIDCHMCDYSSDVQNFRTPLKEGRQTFRKKWLDVATGGDNISLDDWISEEAPSGDLLLQIDIEGAEFRNILSVSDAALSRFRVIVLEVHALSYMMNAPILRGVIAPFFRKLAKFFAVAHAHPNNCCGDFAIPGTSIRIPHVLELTYIRKDRLASQGRAPLVPHPLDVSRNVPRNPPLFLGEEWLENGRPLESRVKIMEDRFDHLAQSVAAQPAAPSVELANLIARSVHTLSERTAGLAAQSEPRADRSRDVAAGRPFVLSNSHGQMASTGSVEPAEPFFFHTAIAKNQFIRIDLGETHTIGRLRITNWTDTCFERANNLFAILSTSGDAGRESVFHFHAPEAFLSGAEKSCELRIPPSPARFVTLISPAETALHFSDLKIFAVD